MLSRRGCGVFVIASMFVSSTLYGHVPHDIIRALGISPEYESDGLVFASADQFGVCILRSTDHGETFSEAHGGLETRAFATGMTFSPNFKNDKVVYLFTDQGYYKSEDRGINWQRQPHLRKQSILSIWLDDNYSATQDAYVLTRSGLYLSKRNGASLETLKTFPAAARIGRLCRRSNSLYVHTAYYDKPPFVNGQEVITYKRGQVHVYDLANGSWASLNSELEDLVVADFDVAANSDHSTMIASSTDGRIMTSNDRGDTWTPTYELKGDFAATVRISPNYGNDGTMIMGTANGYAYKSTDQGASWTLVSNGLNRWIQHKNIHVTQLEFSPSYARDNTIFLGKTEGLFKSTDNAAFWRYVAVWPVHWGFFASIAPDYSTSQNVFLGTYNAGIFKSEDGGNDWLPITEGIELLFANGVLVSPNYDKDKALFVMDIASGVHKSTDGGQSYVQNETLSKLLPDPNQAGKYLPLLYRELAISPNFEHDGLLLLFVLPRYILGGNDTHVFTYSEKTGVAKEVSVGSGTGYITGFAFPPSYPSHNRIFCGSTEGLFASDDSGDTWIQVAGQAIDNVLISPTYATDKTVYAMTRTGKIIYSTDSGNIGSFRALESGLEGRYVYNITVSPNYESDNTLYVCTLGDGVIKTSDGGRTWKEVGLRGRFLYDGLTFSPAYNEDATIFAASLAGIHRSRDRGATWEPVLNRSQYQPRFHDIYMRDPDGKSVTLDWDAFNYNSYRNSDDLALRDQVTKMLPRGHYQMLRHKKATQGVYYKYLVNVPGYDINACFTGTSVDYRCIMGPDLGIVEILLDGESQGTVDLYSPSLRVNVSGFSKQGMKKGFHTFTIRSTGTKNAKSTGTSITLNSIDFDF
ncbi:hypothetical protein [Planctomycetes bacterium CA13]